MLCSRNLLGIPLRKLGEDVKHMPMLKRGWAAELRLRRKLKLWPELRS